MAARPGEQSLQAIELRVFGEQQDPRIAPRQANFGWHIPDGI
jgi:hypothetical protein